MWGVVEAGYGTVTPSDGSRTTRKVGFAARLGQPYREPSHADLSLNETHPADVIISHRHKFIFLKPRKVAGTSVEVALARECGEDDIITPVRAFNARWDDDEYEHPGRNWPGFSRHSKIRSIRRHVSEAEWTEYFKFSVIRNPWDLVVSQYHWARRGGRLDATIVESLARFVRRPRRVRRNFRTLGSCLVRHLSDGEEVSFETFARFMLRYYAPNDGFYFDRQGFALDFVIRFDQIEAHFAQVCDRLGLSSAGLPSLKSKARPKDRHYSTYYTDRTRRAVARKYRRQIDEFGYRFEDG